MPDKDVTRHSAISPFSPYIASRDPSREVLIFQQPVFVQPFALENMTWQLLLGETIVYLGRGQDFYGGSSYLTHSLCRDRRTHMVLRVLTPPRIKVL